MSSNGDPQEMSAETQETFFFGKYKIDPTEVFITTKHSFGFVNLKPVVPGEEFYAMLVISFYNAKKALCFRVRLFQSISGVIDAFKLYVVGMLLYVPTPNQARVVHRFLDLTPEEASDLWLTAKCIGQKLESFYKATSLTFTIQDGPQAGQTVPHVHVHILPRKRGDFENNDEVYDVIDSKERELSEKLNLDKERKDRTFDEMAAEAAQLRALF